MAKKEKEDEFEILLRNKQHNETIAALKNIASVASKDNTSELLSRHKKTVGALIASVRQQKRGHQKQPLFILLNICLAT